MTRKSPPPDADLEIPEASPADVEALRNARRTTVDLERATRLARALPEPGYEELARRPIMVGEPFRL